MRVDLVAAVFRPELRLVDCSFNLVRVKLTNEQLFGHQLGALGFQSSEHGLDPAIGEDGIDDVFIELPEALMGEYGKQTSLAYLIEHVRDI